MDTCKTVKVKSTHPKTQGEFVEINECDFDEKKHEKFEAKKAKKAKKE